MATTPTFLRKIEDNTKKFVHSQRMYIALRSGDTFPNEYVRFDATKGTKITQSPSEYSEIDDSGRKVVVNPSIESVTCEGMILPRDENVRKMFMSSDAQTVKDKFYSVVILGAKLKTSANATVTEMWVFPKVRFTQAFDYEIGGEAKFAFKFEALANDTGNTIGSIPLPTTLTGTGSTGGWDLATGTQTITWGINEFFYTEDEA
jgi:hypothetical protein